MPTAGAVAPPTGLVTFLFSDIEGSTQRWDRYPAQMQVALRRHDALMREAIKAHRGFVFKTIGDAFCAAFPSAADAVRAALAAQQTLAAEDFACVEGVRVRMALHAGVADERDGDYFGPPLNRVARLLAVAYGGQVVASEACADLARDALPGDASLLDLGYHRLKDLTKSERVYQLCAPGLQRDFPKLRSLNERSNNFPIQAGPLIGRAREVGEIVALLSQHRLVTLVGAGGIGKTRAALQAGSETLERYADGAWFVELAPLADAALIPGAIARDLGMQLPDEADSRNALVAILRDKHLLLVLDNCEHLIPGVAEVAASILRASPRVNILASSRQALAIAGEAAYRIPSLAVPPATDVPNLDAACAVDFGAIELFVARAHSANSRFRLDDANAPAIARVCRRLDGIALAIELAAARANVLSPAQLYERLDQRFRLLTGGRRDALPRQQTLRAAIDWSYDLLAERERAAFCALAIFVNGFTLEAAEAVIEGCADVTDALDVVGSLVERSLVVAEVDERETRFRLLETVREYALERLTERAAREGAAARHLAHFHALAERTEADHRETGSDATFMSLLAQEMDDVRAATNWALEGGDVCSGAALVAAIGHPLSRLGLGNEGIARIDGFLAALGEREPQLLARLLVAKAWLAANAFRSLEGYAAAERAIAFARATNDVDTLITAQYYFAYAATRLRRFDEASRALDEAERLAGPAPSVGRRLYAVELRAFHAQLSGAVNEAIAAYSEQRALLRSLGDVFSEANVTVNIAELEHQRGNTYEAIALARELLPRAAHLIGREQHASLQANLAGYLLAAGDTAGARAAAREAIQLLAGADAQSVILTVALEHFALVLASEGDFARAATLEGYCDAGFHRVGYQRENTETVTHRELTARLNAALDDSALESRFAIGAAMTLAQAVGEAFA